MIKKFNYIRTADAIYAESFARVKADITLSDLPDEMHAIVIRMVHACANPHIIPHIAYTDNAPRIGYQALQHGCPIICDSTMVASGINRRLLPTNNDIICTLNHVQTPQMARTYATTRCAGAVELWQEHLKGAIVIIGNAPTALFHMLERILNDEWESPAMIIAMPIGYVGATESKDALITHAPHIPHITLRGKMGGSAMACAVVNAILGSNEATYNDVC